MLGFAGSDSYLGSGANSGSGSSSNLDSGLYEIRIVADE